MNRKAIAMCLLVAGVSQGFGAEAHSTSGVYPGLAYFNNEGECGTGAVVPWANRLWVITYGPHFPKGSSDKLYEIDSNLNVTIRPEGIGGTPANRFIHKESQQLFIGPYAIDTNRTVRVLTPQVMPGRLTGNARHLTEPANKIYYATMEEGFYEVDVRTLSVNQLYPDSNGLPGGHAGALLPGYHGKGLYSGQGKLVYANNGELSKEAQARPDIASGCLAEWDGKDWRVVRRNQFTEVTGPGGIYGNGNPDKDPLWSVGWDHRSLMLMVLDSGQWHVYRLPKASHTYDGAHGWNTEWPRIRDIGSPDEPDLLMTMHGMFWRFPKTFSPGQSAGIVPRSTYLKVIGDFCRWNNKVVFGCDDTAKNEFLNKRKAKGNIQGPGQSQSNLWFVEPNEVDEFGVPSAKGAVWLAEDASETSEPFMFSGFERRALHLAHQSEHGAKFLFEVDRAGNGQWSKLREVDVPVKGYLFVEFEEKGTWIRIKPNRPVKKATAMFVLSNPDRRSTLLHQKFEGVARPNEQSVSGGIIRARGENKRTLHFASTTIDNGKESSSGYYEMGAELKLKRVEDPTADAWLRRNVAIPTNMFSVDDASVVFIDDNGKRWRLPKSDASFDQQGALGVERIDREVCTERDLFNCHGTFYDLPAENAGGFAKIRPIATHNRRIKDYCSYRGLLVLSGVSANAPAESRHIVRSEDGKTSLWVGVVDDLWKFGKARGKGGPLKNTPVKAGQASDPYLMNGYEQKSLTLQHDASIPVEFRIEVDISGTGIWVPWKIVQVAAGQTWKSDFPPSFQAYWLRVVASQNCRASAQLEYR